MSIRRPFIHASGAIFSRKESFTVSQLQKEIDAWVSKTPRSAAAYQRARRYVPGGVGSNFRFMDPYPMFVSRAHGSRIFDLDGNEFIDFMLSMGSLLEIGRAHV